MLFPTSNSTLSVSLTVYFFEVICSPFTNHAGRTMNCCQNLWSVFVFFGCLGSSSVMLWNPGVEVPKDWEKIVCSDTLLSPERDYRYGHLTRRAQTRLASR